MVYYSRVELIQWIVLIILVGLNLALFFNGIQLSCEKCTIKFSNTQVGGVQLSEPMLVAEIKASDLYKEFNNGSCMIKFERTRGYYL